MVRAAAHAASVSASASHTSPGRVRPERRLPPDSLWPGHRPAQDARCAEDGKRVMSAPVSATIASAVRWPDAGNGLQAGEDVGVVGGQLGDAVVKVADGVVEPVDVVQ